MHDVQLNSDPSVYRVENKAEKDHIVMLIAVVLKTWKVLFGSIVESSVKNSICCIENEETYEIIYKGKSTNLPFDGQISASKIQSSV